MTNSGYSCQSGCQISDHIQQCKRLIQAGEGGGKVNTESGLFESKDKLKRNRLYKKTEKTKTLQLTLVSKAQIRQFMGCLSCLWLAVHVLGRVLGFRGLGVIFGALAIWLTLSRYIDGHILA